MLGSWGVDVTNNLVWAVLNHNSEFGAATETPEPGPAMLICLGLGLCYLRRRKTKESRT